jgi:hypothetical protein
MEKPREKHISVFAGSAAVPVAECRILFAGGEALGVRKLACAFYGGPISPNKL